MPFEPTDYLPYDFANRRHIGPSPEEMDEMLEVLGVDDLEALIDETVPKRIRQKETLDFGRPMSERVPPRTPDDVRVAVDRALARLPAEAAADAPRQLAVTLALAEGITAEEALARCGVDLPADAPAAPHVAFVRVPPGGLFRWAGRRWRKVPATVARRLMPGGPNAHPVGGGDGRCFLPTEPVGLVHERRRRRAA